MNQLFEQLGIDWKLFLSQVVNFFVLLAVLTFFMYKPLIKIIKERNQKIKEGLAKAEEADLRLKDIDNIGKEKIKEAEQQSINILKNAEERAKILDRDLQKKAEERQKETLELIKRNALMAQEEANKKVLAQSAELVKKAIVKTVELSPEKIDEALIKKAVSEINKL